MLRIISEVKALKAPLIRKTAMRALAWRLMYVPATILVIPRMVLALGVAIGWIITGLFEWCLDKTEFLTCLSHLADDKITAAYDEAATCMREQHPQEGQ